MALFDSNAITLAQYATYQKPEVQAFIRDFLMPYSILNDMKLKTNPNLKAKVVQVLPEHVPSTYTGWTTLQNTPNVYRSGNRDHEEQMYLIANIFQMDIREQRQTDLLKDPMKEQWETWKQHTLTELNLRFIDNDHADLVNGNAEAFVGLRGRFANQPRYKQPARNSIDAGGLDISVSGISDSTAARLFELIQFGLTFVGDADGNDCSIYTNYLMSGRIVAAGQKAPTLLDQTKDQFDRRIRTFANANIRDLGFRIDDATMIVNLEDVDGTPNANGNYTSLWIVKWGEEGMLGWQPQELKPKDLGIDPTNGVKRNMLVDWGIGLNQAKPRGIARIFGIKIR